MKQTRFMKFIIASLAVHFLISGTVFLGSQFEQQNKSDVIELVVLDSEVVTDQALDDKNPAKQIVETDTKNANDQLDKNAKFLSEKSNTVEKETRAKTGEQFKNSLKQGAPVVKAVKIAAPQKPTTEELLNPTFDPYAAMVRKNPQQNFGEAQRDPATAKMGAQPGDTSTTNDRVDAADDLMTRLNTKEYKYYGYYHRIKVQLNQWWQPKVREKVSKLVSQGRNIASQENKITRLIITLDNVGKLVKVQVLAESGVRDLDEAAVDAFRSAAPFPNPPKGIIESDGTVKIRWDFVVES